MVFMKGSRKTVERVLIGLVSVALLGWFGMCMVRPYFDTEPEPICAPGLWGHGSCVLEDPNVDVVICQLKAVGVSSDRMGEIEVEHSAQMIRIRSAKSEVVVSVANTDKKAYLLAVNFDSQMAVMHSAGNDITMEGAQPTLRDVSVLTANSAFQPALSSHLSQYSRWNVSSVRPNKDYGFTCLLLDSASIPTKLLRLSGDSAVLLPVDNAVDLSGDGQRALLADDLDQGGTFRIVDVESGLEIWRFFGAQLPTRVAMSFALDWSGDRCFVFETFPKQKLDKVTIVHRDGRSITTAARKSTAWATSWFGAWVDHKKGGTIVARFRYGSPSSKPSNSQGGMSSLPGSKG